MPLIGLVVLAELAVLVRLLPQDLNFWELVDRVNEPMRQARHTDHLAALRRGDPALGASVLPASGGPLARALKGAPAGPDGPGGPTVVLLTGPCTDCAGKELFRWSEVAQASGRGPLVVISRDTRERVAAFVSSTHFPYPIVSDPDGRIGRPFHPVWVPRAYGVSRDGRLTWIQTDDRTHPHVVVEAVWRGKGV